MHLVINTVPSLPCLICYTFLSTHHIRHAVAASGVRHERREQLNV